MTWQRAVTRLVMGVSLAASLTAAADPITVRDTVFYSTSFEVGGIAVDAKGTVAVANYGRRGGWIGVPSGDCTYQLYDSQGESPRTIIAGTAVPQDVCFGPDGLLYAAEGWFGAGISVYDREGNKVRRIGGSGRGPGEFHVDFEAPASIAVAKDGSVYAVSSSRHCVFKYSREGKYLLQIGGPGEAEQNLSSPSRVEVSPVDGNVFVLNDRGISVFDAQGKFLRKIRGGINFLAVGPEGNLFTFTTLLDPHGQVLKVFPHLGGDIRDAALGPDGRIYVVPA
ncbi:MAG: NHL repeat-containing protein [Acidobacteria bacterium]|nr:NHL repeat-containing protein [Acidobacteriota bacterium]